MENMEEVRRSARTIIKTEIFDPEEQLWKHNFRFTPEEQEVILECIKMYGHKAVEKIFELVPRKTVEDIRHFLLFVHNQACKNNEVVSGVEYWLDKSKAEKKKTETTSISCSYLPALVMKYLSIDGLLEKHPKPEICGEIDFMAVYRLLYQALMGYPLQPVNQATADFISDNFNEILAEKNPGLSRELSECMKKRFEAKVEPFQGSRKLDSNVAKADVEMPFNNKKPLIVYKRKRPFPFSNPDSLNQVNSKPLQVVCEEKGPGEPGNSKFYSVAVKGKNQACSVVVPVPVEIKKSALEIASASLWKNSGFNPLELTQENLKKHFGNKI